MTAPTEQHGAEHAAERAALEVVRRLQGAGHVAYFAGGCVRDRLMGRAPKDFDVATSAVPDQVLGLFPRSQMVGVAFGVVIVRQGKAQVEVATFRTEGTYSDGRRPDSVAFTTPEVDARRRDFTCNGLFFDPVAGRLHDFVGGRADIEAKVLRAIGEPRERFAEDHLRMMRAVRFAAKLGFSVEPGTWGAVRELAPKIRGISRERVGEELRMMLEHPARATAVRLLDDAGLLAEVWPPALWGPPPHDFRLLETPGPMARATGLAALQECLVPYQGPAVPPMSPQEAGEALKAAFALSNEEAAAITWLLDHARHVRRLDGLGRAPLKRLLAHLLWPALWRIWRDASDPAWAARVDARAAEMRAEGVAPPPLITGDELIRLGARPGKQFKGWLDALYDRQLENEFASREQAIEAARALINR